MSELEAHLFGPYVFMQMSTVSYWSLFACFKTLNLDKGTEHKDIAVDSGKFLFRKLVVSMIVTEGVNVLVHLMQRRQISDSELYLRT